MQHCHLSHQLSQCFWGHTFGSWAATVDDSGSFTLTAALAPSGGTQTSFAVWGTFIDQFTICSSPFVPGTLTGPIFTNGAWAFSEAGPYIFTDSVGSVSGTAGFAFAKGPCDQKPASSDTHKSGNNKSTISPTFQSGFNLAQPAVPLPQNDYSQRRAVLDRKVRQPRPSQTVT